jgi:hypothetical protein
MRCSCMRRSDIWRGGGGSGSGSWRRLSYSRRSPSGQSRPCCRHPCPCGSGPRARCGCRARRPSSDTCAGKRKRPRLKCARPTCGGLALHRLHRQRLCAANRSRSSCWSGCANRRGARPPAPACVCRARAATAAAAAAATASAAAAAAAAAASRVAAPAVEPLLRRRLRGRGRGYLRNGCALRHGLLVVFPAVARGAARAAATQAARARGLREARAAQRSHLRPGPLRGRRAARRAARRLGRAPLGRRNLDLR